MVAKRTVLAIAVMVILVLALIVGCQPAPTPTPQEGLVYGGAVYFPPGGNQLVVGSGGEIEVQPGALLDIQAGATAVFSLDVVSNTTYLKVAAPTAVATNTPAAIIDSAGVSNILEVRDAATPVFAIRNGGTAVLGSYTLAWSAPITITGVLTNVRVLYYQVP